MRYYLILFLFLASCQTVQTPVTTHPQPLPKPVESRIALSWDNGTRDSWSDAIISISNEKTDFENRSLFFASFSPQPLLGSNINRGETSENSRY